jgi:rubrerythrin
LFEGKTPILPVPERRPLEKQARAYGMAVETPAAEKEKPLETTIVSAKAPSEIKLKFWYCKQCGYVVFREDPPYICPICKAKREIFAEITIRADTLG